MEIVVTRHHNNGDCEVVFRKDINEIVAITTVETYVDDTFACGLNIRAKDYDYDFIDNEDEYWHIAQFE